MNNIIINRPDDWHIHLRDGDYLQHTVPAAARHFARVLAMPNLKPPLTTLKALQAYHQRILQSIPEGKDFSPYLTYYLNDTVNAAEWEDLKEHPYILGAKLYPAGATTNSDQGAKSLKALYPHLEKMQELNLVLQIHGEVTHGDIFAREASFIEEELKPLVANFPRLRIVLEHISTAHAVEFVQQAPDTVAATITVHHLLYNRNNLLAGGLRPHYYCLPILKHENHQKALILAATSGNPKFFAGTDSAPHSLGNKLSACGCAGVYSSPYALPLYAQAFEQAQKLNQLNAFLSVFGAQFYELPINQEQIELVKKPESVPESLPFGSEQVVPIAAGEILDWRVHGN